MSFPPPPRAELDWEKTSAETHVHGHIECRWTHETGSWSEPEFIHDPYLRVHGLSPVLHYGQEAYEGLKAFRAPGGDIHVVRPDYHARRLIQSSGLVSIPPVPEELFLSCVNLAVGMNADIVPPHDAQGMLYIRPVVFGMGAWLRLEPPNEYLFCVFVTTAGAFHGSEPLDALILEDFDRAAPRGTGSGKVGGNYSPVIRWSQQAKRDGYDITLHLDSQTRTEIEEFSTSAFVGTHVNGQNVTLVVPDTTNVVSSVTSDSVQQLAKSLGWAVEKRPIKYDELSTFSEVMACGTAVTLVSIRSITRKSTSDKFLYQSAAETMGPCAKQLSTLLHDIYRGKIADEFGWRVKVQEPSCFRKRKAADEETRQGKKTMLNGHAEATQAALEVN
ncbi:Branched-chain-amino-acid transaminase [Purpureocillium takamizusanense]|uniref:Branched-chain-amino-acid transaminase n=1 Tax=Purpureocillium takamizusanense TaxID=2060973 RepID=A0A9Q8V7W2_9HYPO|nr:Branched-chain-amino-acid transaminase [Purpureocillium takamizusanense]UNI16445.1 Branched-chain-amino-acid transaminase [Purpureocillium takamizusanense]